MAKVAEATVRLSLEDKLTRGLNRIKTKFNAFSKGIGFNRIAASTKNLTKSLQGLNKGFSQSIGRAGKLTALLGLGGGGLAASLYGLSKNTAQMAMELVDASKQLGVGVVDLQLWRHAAQRSGVAVGEMDGALSRFNRRTGEAVNGNKAFAAGFEELGVSLRDGGGKLKSNKQLLEEVANGLGRIESQATRARIASKLFGGTGKEIAALMSGGMKPIEELFDEKRSFGDLIGQDVADAGGGLMGSLDQLKGHLNGIKTLLGVHLMPIVHDIINAIKDWVIENKELIRSGIEKWCAKLRQVITDLQDPASDLRQQIAGWIESFQNFYDKVSPVVDFLGGPLKVGLVGLVGYITGPMIIALALVGKAFIALGITIMTTPVGWILGGIAAIVAAGYFLWKNWDDICQWLGDAWDGFCTWFKNLPFVKWLIQLGEDIAGWWGDLKAWWDELSLVDEGWKLIESLSEGIKSAWIAVWDFFVDIGSKIWEAIKGAYSTLTDIGGQIIDWIWEGLKAGWDNVVEWFKGALDTLTSWLPDSVRGMMGFDVDVAPNMAGMEAVNSTVNHLVAAAPANPGAQYYRLPVDPVQAALDAQQLDKVERMALQPQSVEAMQMAVQKFEVPEPLMVHKPTQVDSSITIQNLTVQSSGTPEDVHRAITRAMAGISQNQVGNVSAALND